MKRRSFIKHNAMISGGALLGGPFISELMSDEKVLAAAQTLSSSEKMIRVGCPFAQLRGSLPVKSIRKGRNHF
jgi:hypothetical protein